ncbi:MAG: ABC transporter permease [Anaerolineae bacterium]|nr:MAG: ABC transporter permease [Anaerolineae bacterium]
MKILHIAWKDTITRLRDRRAIIGFLLAPLVVAGLIGAAFGPAFRGERPLSDIPIFLVNEDTGEIGDIYAEVLSSPDLDGLFAVTESDDLAAARAAVESGDARAAVHIPADFSEDLLAAAQTAADVPVTVAVYTDPTASISPFIVSAVVERITLSVNTLMLSGQIGTNQALSHAALLGPALAELDSIVPQVIEAQAETAGQTSIGLTRLALGEEETDANPFSYFAPATAIFFLMFSMMDSTRSILQEETMGTLPRLITTPTPVSHILLGKIGGAFLTGILQFLVLVLASAVIFRLDWGNPLALAAVMLATVFAATSLGALISALARNETQAGILGSAITLVSAALGGTFAQASTLPAFMQPFSKMTINRWSLDAFLELTFGQADMAAIFPHLGVLLGMAAVFFFVALVLFQRRFVR